ncbi:MAG: GNAT family N-acetyltransferase [Actinomycetota bacterium]
MESRHRVRRHRDPAELIALLEPEEPYSTFLVSNLLERGSTRETRTWVVERDETIVAVLVIARSCPLRWYSAPFLLEADENVARALVGIIDRSSARSVTGPASHVNLLLPHLSRKVSAWEVPFLHQPAPVANPRFEPGPTTRAAGPEDLDDLVALYAGFEQISFVSTLRWLRGLLAPLVDEGRVIVAAEDGRLAGAIYLDRLSHCYAYWTGLTIDPAFRGRRLSWGLWGRALEVTAALGVGYMIIVDPTNPMRMKEREAEAMARERWVWSGLNEPHRYPGERTIRRWWIRLNGPPTMPRGSREPKRDDSEWLG